MNAKKNTKPTDTSAPPRAKMHPRKEQLNCRVSPLVKRLIKLEWERSCDSEGQAVEALVLPIVFHARSRGYDSGRSRERTHVRHRPAGARHSTSPGPPLNRSAQPPAPYSQAAFWGHAGLPAEFTGNNDCPRRCSYSCSGNTPVPKSTSREHPPFPNSPPKMAKKLNRRGLSDDSRCGPQQISNRPATLQHVAGKQLAKSVADVADVAGFWQHL